MQVVTRELQLIDEVCPKCSGAVLDEVGAITSFCSHCSHVWLTNGVHNPLAHFIKVDLDLLQDFQEVFERCGKLLVGKYDSSVENQLFDLLLFAEPGMYLQTSDGLGSSLSTQFEIKIDAHAKPVCHDLRKYSRVKNDFIDSEVKKMRELGVVEPYLGPWQSSLVVAPKPGPGQDLRLCIDLRDVNNISESVKYPLPSIDEIIQSLGGSFYYSKLDLAKGFWQVPVKKQSQCYLAFVTRRGVWKFVRMPFGHKNAPGIFQAMMNAILEDVLYVKCFVFIDDVIVFGKSQEECIANTKDVIDLIYSDNLKLGCLKCEFVVDAVEVLGHVVSEGTLYPKTDKVQGLTDLKRPGSLTEVKSLYGLLSFFRKFVKNFSVKCRPITELMTAEHVVWTDKQEVCLKQLIDDICAGGLLLPQYDQQFIVTTDFSYQGIGGMVSQVVNGVEKPVMFVSRVLNKAEQNYSPTEGEALAIVFTLRRCQHLLYGQKVLIRTDHRPLTFISGGSEANRKLARWWSILTEFDYDLEYVVGKSNLVADALSRLTCGVVCHSNETLELNIPQVLTAAAEQQSDCGFCDEEYDFCDRCGCQMCLVCGNGTPSHLPYVYCKNCVALLDEKDPTMNIPLLRMLVEADLKPLRSAVGYEKFQQLERLVGSFSVVGDQLYKHFDDRVKQIPSVAKRKEILCDIHETGGHVGVMKVYHMARSLYYWPGLMEDCVQLVSQCVDCMKLKGKLLSLPLKPSYKFDRPFQCWNIDYMPKLPTNQEGYSHILVCVDPFSKWVELFPMKTKSSEEVWSVLYGQLFARFGLPLELRSDRGREFAGVVSSKCKQFGIRLVRISVQNPQANGQAERYVGVVKRAVKTVLSQFDWDVENWQLCLPACLMGLRFYEHRRLGVSPFMVCHGMVPRLPIKGLPMALANEFSYDERLVENFVSELVREMTWLCKEVVRKLARADELEKRKYDARLNEQYQFSPGDQVLVKNRSKGSLESALVGPYTFVRFKDLSEYACILCDEDGYEFDCSVSHLVPVDKRNVLRRMH